MTTDEAPKKGGGLTWYRLGAIAFVMTTCGPFGIESAMNAGGAVLTMAAIFVIPVIYVIPQVLMVSEMAMMMPSNHGYIIWVQRGWGSLLSFFNGYNSVIVNTVDMAVYPVLASNYLLRMLARIGYLANDATLMARDFANPAYRIALLFRLFMIVLAAFVSCLNTENASKIAMVLAVLVVGVFMFLFVACLPDIDPSTQWTAKTGMDETLSSTDWGAFTAAILWMYTGWNGLGSLAGDVGDEGAEEDPSAALEAGAGGDGNPMSFAPSVINSPLGAVQVQSPSNNVTGGASPKNAASGAASGATSPRHIQVKSINNPNASFLKAPGTPILNRSHMAGSFAGAAMKNASFSIQRTASGALQRQGSNLARQASFASAGPRSPTMYHAPGLQRSFAQTNANIITDSITASHHFGATENISRAIQEAVASGHIDPNILAAGAELDIPTEVFYPEHTTQRTIDNIISVVVEGSFCKVPSHMSIQAGPPKPKAGLNTVFVNGLALGLFLGIIMYFFPLITALTPPEVTNVRWPDGFFVDAMDMAFSGSFYVVILVAIICQFGLLYSSLVCFARIVWGLAELGWLPSALQHLHPTLGSPVNATLAQAAALVPLMFFDLSYLQRLEFTLAAIAYTLTYTSFLRLRYVEPDTPRPFTVPGGKPAAWFLVCLKLCVMFTVAGSNASDPLLMAMVLGVNVCIGIGYYFVGRNLGAIDEEGGGGADGSGPDGGAAAVSGDGAAADDGAQAADLVQICTMGKGGGPLTNHGVTSSLHNADPLSHGPRRGQGETARSFYANRRGN